MKKQIQKFRKNIFLKKVFFVTKNTIKSSQHEKFKKKFFLGQIGLQFFAAHWSAFNSTVFGLASIDREIFFGHIGSSIEKIRRGKDLHLKSKRRKMSTRGRWKTARTLPPGEPMG